jgi:hypothetical protein
MYSSVVPDPEVPWVQAGLEEVDVAKVTGASAGPVPDVKAMELGYSAWPETWVSFSHSTV